MLAYKSILFNIYLYSNFYISSPVLHSEDVGMNEACISPKEVLSLLIDVCMEKSQCSKCYREGLGICHRSLKKSIPIDTEGLEKPSQRGYLW